LSETADIVIAAAPGRFVDKLTGLLPPDRTIWIHPDSAHRLDGIDEGSVGVVVISETDCSEATLIAVLAASRVHGWRAFVLSQGARIDHRDRWLNAGATAVLSDRLAAAAVAILVRETLFGNLHMAQRYDVDRTPEIQDSAV
jgi:hypothetical protein